MQCVPEFAQQTGFANPRIAADGDSLPVAFGSLSQVLLEQSQLLLPPDQWCHMASKTPGYAGPRFDDAFRQQGTVAIFERLHPHIRPQQLVAVGADQNAAGVGPALQCCRLPYNVVEGAVTLLRVVR